jgi:hypothetical protein
MNDSYRFDIRSKEQFTKDIKDNSIKEAEIAIRLGIFLFNENKKWPTIEPNGIDYSGKFIENSKDVKGDPDYTIDGTPVEITRSDVICKSVFHQKKSKIDRCIKNKDTLVFVNGFRDAEEPMFLFLRAEFWQSFSDMASETYGKVSHPAAGTNFFINKTSYRYNIEWFKDLWRPLPKIVADIPKRYKAILKAVNGDAKI